MNRGSGPNSDALSSFFQRREGDFAGAKIIEVIMQRLDHMEFPLTAAKVFAIVGSFHSRLLQTPLCISCTAPMCFTGAPAEVRNAYEAHLLLTRQPASLHIQVSLQA
ncbi:hypothetical protein MLD38_007558 [Melastoma candidum]|uniref:Uncharacterized protein n=1 Tax=Melastoma candidum TaxID=119954 RepID=A0ACB9RRH1_9MYRT|nr:hypothetical protein MLD38_007558 [Melastoma candidum]